MRRVFTYSSNPFRHPPTRTTKGGALHAQSLFHRSGPVTCARLAARDSLLSERVSRVEAISGASEGAGGDTDVVSRSIPAGKYTLRSLIRAHGGRTYRDRCRTAFYSFAAKRFTRQFTSARSFSSAGFPERALISLCFQRTQQSCAM